MSQDLLVPSNHRQAERTLIQMVQSGKWRIDESGKIWKPDGRRAEKILPSGYLMVRAMFNGKRHCGVAHRLVWQNLFGDIPDGLIINHRNGQKGDNKPNNLELATYSENLRHAYRLGLADEFGERNPAAKLTNHQVAEIRVAYASGDYSMESLGKLYGVSFQHVSSLVKGHRRPKQPGPILTGDLREHNEFPEVEISNAA